MDSTVGGVMRDHKDSESLPALPSSRSTAYPVAAQWEAVKDEIRVLYEKHPLREVRTIMEKRHGFRAT